MDFNLTDEQELLLESVDEFCERYFTDEAIAEMYETGTMPDEIAEAYRDAGFGLMGIPEEFGGIPADRQTIGLMIERLYEKSGCMHILYQNSLSMFDNKCAWIITWKPVGPFRRFLFQSLVLVPTIVR